MTAKARGFIEHLTGHFSSGLPDRLGVAVSGGSDSTALLVLLKQWSGGPVILAATVDHGLRAEAVEEAAAVAKLCSGLGVNHEILTWKDQDSSGNLMHRARNARYSLLAEWARTRDIRDVAIGHTLDDIAETLLMRLQRGAGLDGLSAMARRFEWDGVVFHRPLLEASRAGLRDMLRDYGIGWCDDPTNVDPEYDRARVRSLMGSLDLNAETLARSARHLRAARSALEQIAARVAQDSGHFDYGDFLIPRAALLNQPDEISRRVIVAALHVVGDGGYPPRGEAVTRLMGAIRDGAEMSLNGARLLQRGGILRIVRDWSAVAMLRVPADRVWDDRWQATGPDEGCSIAPLGEAGLGLCPDRKSTGRPAASLIASPAIWQGERLVAAPLAGLENGWSLRLSGDPAQRLARVLLH